MERDGDSDVTGSATPSQCRNAAARDSPGYRVASRCIRPSYETGQGVTHQRLWGVTGVAALSIIVLRRRLHQPGKPTHGVTGSLSATFEGLRDEFQGLHLSFHTGYRGVSRWIHLL